MPLQCQEDSNSSPAAAIASSDNRSDSRASVEKPRSRLGHVSASRDAGPWAPVGMGSRIFVELIALVCAGAPSTASRSSRSRLRQAI